MKHGENKVNHQSQTKTAIFQTVSPDLAKHMLSTSNGNRPLKQTKVEAYTRDMRAGKWQENGEAIVVDCNGSLIDGHHRLTARLRSGVAFSALVVRGVEPDSIKTIDMGSSRTIGDVLSFYGYKNQNVISGIVRVLMSIEIGRPGSANPSAQEVFDFVQKHERYIKEAATFSANKHFPRSGSLVGAVHFMASLRGCRFEAERFADVLKTGIPSREGCPAHALRERVSRAAFKGKPMPVRELHLMFFAAWEKFITGQSVKILHVPSSFYASWWPE